MLFRRTAVSGSQECSWGLLTRAKGSIKGMMWNVKKNQYSFFKIMPFQTRQMSLAFGNTTWDLFSQKRAPPQGWNKKPWYVILWNGKMTEEWAWEFRSRCKLNVHNSSRHLHPSPLKGCAAKLVDQGRSNGGGGGGRTGGISAEPGCSHTLPHPSFK